MTLAASKIGRFILAPKQTFSFNDTVGRRTRRRGFHGAPGIRKGILIKDDVGGGVCQVSSTMHAAVVFAGLEIVEARPHSRPSSYIPMGLDAMVYWGSRGYKIHRTIVIAGGLRAGTYVSTMVYRPTHRVHRVGTKPSMVPAGRTLASR